VIVGGRLFLRSRRPADRRERQLVEHFAGGPVRREQLAKAIVRPAELVVEDRPSG
jgi:hypothetical protein